MMTKPYTEQLNRVRRFLKRVRSTEDRLSDDYKDALHAFFQCCWHLKDWVKNDESIPEATRKRVVRRVEEKSKVLAACADVANGTKHLKLLRKPRRPGARLNTGNNVTVFPGSDRPALFTHSVLCDDGTRLIAQDLAEEAVKEWDSVLRDEGLL
jgi:hypothetical protein